MILPSISHRVRFPLLALLILASTLLLWHVRRSSSDAEASPEWPLDRPLVLPEYGPSGEANGKQEQESGRLQPEIPDCPPLPGIEDVFVILKTGATVINKKLPIHFNTTLRCIPNYVIFSDMAEEVDGHQIYDALDEVPEVITKEAVEFELYRQLQDYKSRALDNSELVQTPDEVKKAWDLDKWKFLPIMTKAYALRKAKWYVFMEADTFIFWSNLLRWLEHLHHDEDWYIGGQAYAGDQAFAHGGTGFVISNRSMTRLVEYIESHEEEMETLTRDEWAGDVVLGKAFKKVDVDLTQSWPIFQGDTPYNLDYTEKHYCFPVVSYHHVDAEWIQKLWTFEMEWVSKSNRGASSIIRHKDAFAHFVTPYIQSEQEHWDNLPENDEIQVEPNEPQACRVACEEHERCVEWRYNHGEKCKFGEVIRLGERKESLNATSGWITARVDQFKRKMEPCTQGWIGVS